MPIRYTVDPLQHLVQAECSGQVTIDEVRDTMARIRREPFFVPTFALLIDLTGAEALDLDFHRLSEFVRSAAGQSSLGSRRAFVVATQQAYGFARMYQSLADGLSVGIFRTREEAFDWLTRPAIGRP